MTFPLAAKQDSKYHGISQEDATVASKMEGGYVFARPRHTRAPRKTYTTGFTELTQAEVSQMTAHWDLVQAHTQFDWTDPTTLAVKSVRYTKPFSQHYVGMGGTHLWNITDITLEEI